MKGFRKAVFAAMLAALALLAPLALAEPVSFAGLTADGIVDEATWDALYDQTAGIELNSAFETNRFVPPGETPQAVGTSADVVLPVSRIDTASRPQQASAPFSAEDALDRGQSITNADTAFLTQFPGRTMVYGDSDFERRPSV